jgi:hypothetical protein
MALGMAGNDEKIGNAERGFRIANIDMTSPGTYEPPARGNLEKQ